VHHVQVRHGIHHRIHDGGQGAGGRAGQGTSCTFSSATPCLAVDGALRNGPRLGTQSSSLGLMFVLFGAV
jgi:hypothetical protein